MVTTSAQNEFLELCIGIENLQKHTTNMVISIE